MFEFPIDWQTIGRRLAPILTLLFGLGAALCFVAISRSRRTARTTGFGFVREQSESRAKRLLILSMILLMLTIASGGLWGVSVQKPELLPTVYPTATSTDIPSPTPRTPTATFTPTHTPTVTPTPTSTPIPPDASLPPALLTPFPSPAVTPGPDATLVELVLASGEENDAPINPSTNFPPGTERVYAFLTFDGMARNVPWVHTWYAEVDGQMVEVWSNVELWAYDGARGKAWRYLNCQPGRYELHIYIGRRLEQKIPFTVQDAE
jgi:hypothetical protein